MSRSCRGAARLAAVAVALSALTAACSGSSEENGDGPSPSPPVSPQADTAQCPGTTLAVHVPELDRPATQAIAELAAPRTPRTLGVWIGDYPRPDDPASFDPARSGTPEGHARVMLELVSLTGKPIVAGATGPAAATRGADYRATLVIQTHQRVHGAYVNVHGRATLTVDTAHLLCGTFDIGDADEQARGSFRLDAAG